MQVYIILLLCSTLASAVLGTLVLLFNMLYPRKFVMATIVVSPIAMVWVGIQLLFYHIATFNVPIIVGIVVSVFHIGIKMPSASLILAASVRKVSLSAYLFMCLAAVVSVGFYIVGWISIPTVVVYMAHQGDVHNPPVPSSELLVARYFLIALLRYTMYVVRNVFRVSIAHSAWQRIMNSTPNDTPISKDEVSKAITGVFGNGHVLWGLSLVAMLNVLTAGVRLFFGRVIKVRFDDNLSWTMKLYNKYVERIEKSGSR